MQRYGNSPINEVIPKTQKSKKRVKGWIRPCNLQSVFNHQTIQRGNNFTPWTDPPETQQPTNKKGIFSTEFIFHHKPKVKNKELYIFLFISLDL